ncbi:hypothetical protein HYH02_012734 [Chlamydomonas schloesseri]|uniref:Peptidase M11 gametolysin domain-containing protein n=1 Tax=Chlamydomonas schloesseri TaxID=2026947 RepID=A0A835STR7_9CHLO|nr:hypothetical protein HYH02_012734 [Chlamydomonas schloesseri]|eukprot:KAG2433192.1 hypothetical protein HYH02_012734 [Chlamydomonas schloesseri]
MRSTSASSSAAFGIIAVCLLATAQQAAAGLYQSTGRISVVDTSYPSGAHTNDYVLTADEGGIYTLIATATAAAGGDLFTGLVSGGMVRVVSFYEPKLGVPWDIFGLTVISPPPPPMPPSPPPSPPPPASRIGSRASSTKTQPWLSNWNPGVILDQEIPDPPRVVRDLPTLFILLDLCGKGGGPATTEDSLANMLYRGLTPFQDYVATCSYGKAQFDQTNTRILTVKLPCSGVSKVSKMAWDSSSCSKDNLFNWMYEVEYYIDNVLKPKDWNHRRYRHHVIITPPNMQKWAGSDCDWSGMGSIGMAQSTWSYAWVSGDNWQTKQVYLHEMGHNYNLMHAATMQPAAAGGPDTCSHCDWSSAMGFCCETRCMSAPHNYQLGWAKPAATVNGSQLSEGNTLAFELPSQIMSDANFLQVTTDWLSPTSVSTAAINDFGGPAFYNPANATFYFSYRQEFDDFDEVADGYAGGTNVYLFTITSQMDKKDSVHVALLTEASPSWTDPSGSLVVRQVGTSGDTAIVTVCRPEPAGEKSEDACTDFWDNDCDGLIDADDPDCAWYYGSLPSPPPPPPLKKASPPPSPPPPPPPKRSPPPPSPPPPPKRSPPPPPSAPPPGLPPPPKRVSPPPRLAEQTDGSPPPSPAPPPVIADTGGSKKKRPPPPGSGKVPKKPKPAKRGLQAATQDTARAPIRQAPTAIRHRRHAAAS